MKRRLMTALLAGTIAVAAVAAPAVAQDTAEQTPAEQWEEAWEEARQAVLDGIKEHAQHAVDHRLATLDELRKWLREAEHVTSGHAATLRADFDATESGLVALNEKIQATTTVEEAIELTEKIASDYRVYLVLVPKTAGVVVGDSIVAVTDEIERVTAEVQEGVDWLAELGYDVTEVQQAMDDSVAHNAAAASLAAGVSDSVIGLQAADWPSPAVSALEAGKADLEASGDEIERSVERLRDALVLIHVMLRSHHDQS